MVRANIKSPDDQYLGVIDQEDDGFRVLWLCNEEETSGYYMHGDAELFQTFQQACDAVSRVRQDADIIETIYFKHHGR